MSPLWTLLRCVQCGHPLERSDETEPGYPELGPDAVLSCQGCPARYPVVGGTARMLPKVMLDRLAQDYPRSESIRIAAGDQRPKASPSDVKQRTADTFAYTWKHFGPPTEPGFDRKNFLEYMQPLSPDFFRDRLVLDIGSGAGRHSRQAVELGAELVAMDIGRAIDVTRLNLPSQALTVQADAERLPFDRDTFDLVFSIGVLHHLSETERAFSSVASRARPGGHVHVYLYARPERRWHRWLLGLVAAAGKVTTRLPPRLRHLLCYPIAAVCWALFVAPYRVLRRTRRGQRIAAGLPLKAYADYPFGDLVGAQFDYFSTPVQRRFTEDQVRTLLRENDLDEIRVIPHQGWIGDGRRSA